MSLVVHSLARALGLTLVPPEPEDNNIVVYRAWSSHPNHYSLSTNNINYSPPPPVLSTALGLGFLLRALPITSQNMADYSSRHHRECFPQLKLLCISSRGTGSWCSKFVHFSTSPGVTSIIGVTSIMGRPRSLTRPASNSPSRGPAHVKYTPLGLTPAHIPQLQQLP